MRGKETVNKLNKAIERSRAFEPYEGYYHCHSGGKDSILSKIVLDLAYVKYDSHHNHTTVDYPELVYFIRNLKDVEINYPTLNMFELIIKKQMPPTRRARYCCECLKERGGDKRFVVTGVRWEESSRRKNDRNVVELDFSGSQSKKAKENREIFLMADNDHKRMMLETCRIKGKNVLNNIIDFTTEEVWEIIKYYNCDYPALYDEGFERLGCIGCPLTSRKNRIREFERYPKYKELYIKAFDRMLDRRLAKGKITDRWNSGEEVFEWWLSS